MNESDDDTSDDQYKNSIVATDPNLYKQDIDELNESIMKSNQTGRNSER